jgi:anti-anti-sigma factor
MPERYTAEYINQLGLPFIERVEDRDDVRIVRVKGVIDRHTLPAILAFRERVVRAADRQDRHIVMDMAHVTRVDSAAVAVLLMTLAELQQEGRRLGMIHTTEEMLNILSVFEYTDLFEIYDSEEAALASLGDRRGGSTDFRPLS